MNKNQRMLKMYLFPGSAREVASRLTEQVMEIINDKTVKTTEVIRDGGFVHGRVTPIPRSRGPR